MEELVPVGIAATASATIAMHTMAMMAITVRFMGHHNVRYYINIFLELLPSITFSPKGFDTPLCADISAS